MLPPSLSINKANIKILTFDYNMNVMLVTAFVFSLIAAAEWDRVQVLTNFLSQPKNIYLLLFTVSILLLAPNSASGIIGGYYDSTTNNRRD